MSGITGATREVDVAFYFKVRIALSGTSLADVGYFVSVDGLGRRVEPYEYREGGRTVPHRLFNPTPPGELVLRWGNMDQTALWDWANAVQCGKGFRRNVEITHYTRTMTSPVRTILVTGAWPVEWRGAALTSEESRVAVEEVRLAYDNLTMVVARV